MPRLRGMLRRKEENSFFAYLVPHTSVCGAFLFAIQNQFVILAKAGIQFINSPP